MVSFGAKLRPDQEVAVQAIIDAVAARPDLDGGRVGVAGISYGGLFAIRTAAVDDRVRVYGGNDPGSPLSQAERIATEYGGPVTTVIYPDGVHTLNNVWNVARPLVADWLADTL